MNEVNTVIHRRSTGGTRRPSSSTAPEAPTGPGRRLSSNIQAAIDELEPILQGGQWHRRADIEKITKNHGSALWYVAEYMSLAESDKGRWLCLPGPETPLHAPDET